MKLSKLFKKLEDFFSMNEQERVQKSKKMDKLSSTLVEKIECKKEKIQSIKSEKKKEKLKKELEVLKELLGKLKKEQS